MDENIYAAPETSEPAIIATKGAAPLATRLERLGASILDTMISIVIVIPIMIMTGAFEGIMTGEMSDTGRLYEFAIGLVSIVIFFLINFKFLFHRGQTLGKLVVKIRVVGCDNQDVTTKGLLKRYGFYFFLGLIPIIGEVLSIVNVCFIFGSKQQCLHDMFADTKVVKCANN